MNVIESFFSMSHMKRQHAAISCVIPTLSKKKRKLGFLNITGSPNQSGILQGARIFHKTYLLLSALCLYLHDFTGQ